VFKTESDIKESLVDHCGNVDSLSEHAAMLVPFYYLPLLVFVVLIVKKIVIKIQTKFSKKSVFKAWWPCTYIFFFNRVPYKKFSNAGNLGDTLTASQPVNVLTSYVELNEDEDGLVLISRSSEQPDMF